MRNARLMLLALAAALLVFAAGPVRAEPIEIEWWHGMSGTLGDRLQDIVNHFNASQNKYKVVASYKGTYVDVMQQAIAAYRGGKQPDILQIYEVGTQTMISSGAVVQVQDMMKEQGYNIDWSKYVQPVIGYYQASDGKLWSMPFNSSTPIFYYNIDQLAKAGISQPPATWQELFADAKKLKASGQDCALTVGWQFWTQIENYSALHNIPFATESNGYDGLGARLTVNNPQVVKHIAELQQMAKDGTFSYEGRTAQGAAPAFASGKCSMIITSTGDYSNIQDQAKFKFDATYMPVEEGTKPQSSMIGGATLWVMKGKPADHYAGVAAFFNFIAGTDNQVFWHENTGYLPITVAAYEKAKAEGFYLKKPALEIAIKQLTRAAPNKNSRGVRLGNLAQINVVFDEELENVWAQKKTAQQALDDAVRRSDEIVKQFQELYSK